jgi:two-component system NarL family response regulator
LSYDLGVIMPTKGQIRVLLVDDHRFVRQAISRIINGQPDMKVVAEAEDGKIAVDLYGQVLPDVTLMDLNMPEMDGIQAMITIRRSHPEARLIVLSSSDSPTDMQDSSRAGASAYILKDTKRDKLLSIIRDVFAGQRFLSDGN